MAECVQWAPDPTQIGDIHFKHNGTDGVSLVAHTMDRALLARGLSVHRLGDGVKPGQRGQCIPDLSYQSEDTRALTARLFLKTPPAHTERFAQEQAALLGEIEQKAAQIRQTIERYVIDHRLGTVVVRNLFSLPLNMPATHALYQILRDPGFNGVTWIIYHHDFYWESVRNDQFVTPYPEIQTLLNDMYPPNLPEQKNVTHVVLNSLIRQQLKERMGDFRAPTGELSGEPLRERLGIGKDDLMVMVPTRVVPRKAVEFAVALTARLQQKKEALHRASSQNGGLGPHRRQFGETNRIVLVLPQGEDMSDHTPYAEAIRSYAGQLGVELLFAGDYVRPPGAHNGAPGDTRVPFYDVYREADVAVLPSVHEGFGNQLLEIGAAGLVPVLFEYNVFQRDIRLPHVISLGSAFEEGARDERGIALKTLPDETLEGAAKEIIAMLTSPDAWKEKAEENRRHLMERYDASVIAEQFSRLMEIH